MARTNSAAERSTFGRGAAAFSSRSSVFVRLRDVVRWRRRRVVCVRVCVRVVVDDAQGSGDVARPPPTCIPRRRRRLPIRCRRRRCRSTVSSLRASSFRCLRAAFFGCVRELLPGV